MNKNQYPTLTAVSPLGDYRLLLEYSSGEKKIYDFGPNLGHSFYKELSNPVLFQRVAVRNGELEWPTGQDFCPHTLYDKSVPT